MKPLISLVLLAALAPTAQASSGTIRFVGALVEPTCRAEVIEPRGQDREVVVRLHDCRATAPAAKARCPSAVEGADIRRGELTEQTLSEVAATLSGRDRVTALTVSYQ